MFITRFSVSCFVLTHFCDLDCKWKWVIIFYSLYSNTCKHFIFFHHIASSAIEIRWKDNTEEEQYIYEYYARNQSTSSRMMHEAGLDYLESTASKQTSFSTKNWWNNFTLLLLFYKTIIGQMYCTPTQWRSNSLCSRNGSREITLLNISQYRSTLFHFYI